MGVASYELCSLGRVRRPSRVRSLWSIADRDNPSCRPTRAGPTARTQAAYARRSLARSASARSSSASHQASRSSSATLKRASIRAPVARARSIVGPTVQDSLERFKGKA